MIPTLILCTCIINHIMLHSRTKQPTYIFCTPKTQELTFIHHGFTSNRPQVCYFKCPQVHTPKCPQLYRPTRPQVHISTGPHIHMSTGPHMRILSGPQVRCLRGHSWYCPHIPRSTGSHVHRSRCPSSP